jgi:NAD(P)-dependent dehydrogenase (short-subunit alcohol dehydrogenase family)
MFDRTVALVSGAGQGIGRAVAERLLDAGCRVALTDPASGHRRPRRARALDAGAERCRPYALDVRDAAPVRRRGGGSGTGLGPGGRAGQQRGHRRQRAGLDTGDLAGDLDRVMAVNVKGIVHLTQACAAGPEAHARRGGERGVHHHAGGHAGEHRLRRVQGSGGPADPKFLARDFGPASACG